MAFVTVNGTLAKTEKISQTIEIGDDADQFTTTEASVQFFGPSGALLMNGCASAAGQRFESWAAGRGPLGQRSGRRMFLILGSQTSGSRSCSRAHAILLVLPERANVIIS
jgi:hypothetical protein